MSDSLADLPSAHELRISAAHRRALLRESHFRFLRSMAASYRADADALKAREVIAGVVLEIAGGEPEAERVRASYLRSASRYQSECADYLRRRAAGESAREIVASRYPSPNRHDS